MSKREPNTHDSIDTPATQDTTATKECPGCYSDDITAYPAHDELVCEDCGLVLGPIPVERTNDVETMEKWNDYAERAGYIEPETTFDAAQRQQELLDRNNRPKRFRECVTTRRPCRS